MIRRILGDWHNPRQFIIRLSVIVSCLAGLGTCIYVLNASFGNFDSPPINSPDGRFVINIHESNCGATCPFSATADMSDRQSEGHSWLFNDNATTLLSGNIHPCTIMPIWIDANHLTVEYSTHGDVRRGPKSWHGVTVNYLPIDLPDEVWAAGWHAPDLGACYGAWMY